MTIKYTLIGLLALQAFLSYLFEMGEGLVIMSYLVEGELIKVTDLYSSGSDDNVMIGLGMHLYLLAFILLLVRVRNKFGIYDISVLISALFLQFFLIILIEAGSIFDTVLYGGDYILLAWAINLLLISSLLFVNSAAFLVKTNSEINHS